MTDPVHHDTSVSVVHHDASVIVLTGGTGRRLGGIDKATVEIEGQTLLEHVLTALPADVSVLVAGTPLPTSRPVTFRREDPPLGGPVAGINAALPAVTSDLVGVIAVDMPRAVPVLQEMLGALAADTHADVALPVTSDGRQQPLCSAWRADALRDALSGLDTVDGAAMRALLAPMHAREVPLTPAQEALLDDIDSPQDLERVRSRMTGGLSRVDGSGSGVST